MSVSKIKEIIKDKSIDEIARLIHNGELSPKKMRNIAIRDIFYNRYGKKPTMDIYYELTVIFNLSKWQIMNVIKDRE